MKSANLSPEEIKQIITLPNIETRDKFVADLGKEISELSEIMSAVHKELHEVSNRVRPDERSEVTWMFLYAAFDNIVSAAHLLTFGHFLSAGNLVRCWLEAVVMALLCSNEDSDTFERFIKDRDGFRVDSETRKAFENGKISEMLSEMKDYLEIVKELIKFYNQHSHASAFAVYSRHIISEPGKLSLAGEHDPDKKDYYQTEVSIYLYIAGLMQGITKVIEENLKKQ